MHAASTKELWGSEMPIQALCAAPALASLCGGVPSRCSLPKIRDGAARPALTASASVAGLLARQPWVAATACSAILSACIAEKTNKLENVVPIGGKMRSALLRGTNQKRWEVHSSDSEQAEQVQEISEEKTIQTSQEPNGPPVLTIIAGLLVILVVLWVLGSLLSWIVGLIFQ